MSAPTITTAPEHAAAPELPDVLPPIRIRPGVADFLHRYPTIAVGGALLMLLLLVAVLAPVLWTVDPTVLGASPADAAAVGAILVRHRHVGTGSLFPSALRRTGVAHGRLLVAGCAFAGRCPSATELCRRVSPALEQKAPGHLAACHCAAREAT